MHLAALSIGVLGGMLESSSAVGSPVAAHHLKGLRVELGEFVLMPAESGVLQGVS